MKISLVIGALATVAAASPAAAGAYSALYVFGDSLVDSGNDFIATKGAQPPASGGYNAGRFSNGYNLADYLSKALLGTISTPALAGGTNFAFGGALAATDANGIPDLADQLGLYALASGGHADPNALYFINAGGNDGFANVRGNSFAPTPAQVGAAIAGTVSALAAKGARHFLVDNVVNLGNVPTVRAGGPLASAYGTKISIAIDKAIAADLTALTLPSGSTLTEFNAFGLGTRVFADPAAFGLGALNTSIPCQTVGAYPSCAGYLYFDSIHPTDAVYRVFARGIAQTVPEPGAVALLGIGLALAVTRRRVR